MSNKVVYVMLGVAVALLTALVIAILSSGCAWDTPSPSVYQPVPGNECGNLGVECGGHFCCWEGETCGAIGRSCPAGACCNVRMPPAFLRFSDAGSITSVPEPVIVVTHVQRQASP